MISAAPVSLADVLARPDVWRANGLASAPLPALASGFAALDAELPGGGWPRGTLTEILSDGVGIGECSLMIPALRRLADAEKWSLLVAPPQALHAPAWASAGIDLARLIVVSPSRASDALWAAEQALASGTLGSVLCWTTHIDARQVRRLEVAAAGSESIAFLFRPARARTESSPCALRLLLSASARGHLAVELLKRRGPPCRQTLALEVARPLNWREDDKHETKNLTAKAQRREDRKNNNELHAFYSRLPGEHHGQEQHDLSRLFSLRHSALFVHQWESPWGTPLR